MVTLEMILLRESVLLLLLLRLLLRRSLSRSTARRRGCVRTVRRLFYLLDNVDEKVKEV